MPELPEVETIRRLLTAGDEIHPSVVGQRISSADLLWKKTLASPKPDEFSRRIIGQTILSVGRRGKFIHFNLDQEYLVFHLRMSGDLTMNREVEPAAHDRLRLLFESGWILVFNDTRKFGRAWLAADLGGVIGGLGPEPFSAELEHGEFWRRLKQRNRQIKPLLLDQHFLAGLGNIYTDEALFRAGIHPLRLSGSLSKEEAGRLLDAIRVTLEEGIRHNGSSIDWVYRGGDFQNYFQVYQQTGNPCPVCGHAIQKIVIGQRGTHYCGHCQPLRRN